MERGWRVETDNDLDRYTYGVAGATGVLLCDLWAWAGGEQLNRSAAIQFGRGLQAVNILRNRREDLERGMVLLYPMIVQGWRQSLSKKCVIILDPIPLKIKDSGLLAA